MNRNFIAAATIIFASNAAAQQVTTVIGTGDSNLDVRAVQAAVDQGGRVVLKGHFSFDAPPTVAEPPGLFFSGAALGTILISKTVAISGFEDDPGEKTVI